MGESLAMEQFAKALQQLPRILADNAGFDSAELLGQLLAKHAQGLHTIGLSFSDGSVADMAELGICESFKSKMSQLCLVGLLAGADLSALVSGAPTTFRGCCVPW